MPQCTLTQHNNKGEEKEPVTTQFRKRSICIERTASKINILKTPGSD
jgi:hypothetical protein